MPGGEVCLLKIHELAAVNREIKATGKTMSLRPSAMAMKQLVTSLYGVSDFRGIRKSSGLIGAPSMINVGVGTLRTKALRVLLGPSGIGVIRDLPRTFAELAITGLALQRCHG